MILLSSPHRPILLSLEDNQGGNNDNQGGNDDKKPEPPPAPSEPVSAGSVSVPGGVVTEGEGVYGVSESGNKTTVTVGQGQYNKYSFDISKDSEGNYFITFPDFNGWYVMEGCGYKFEYREEIVHSQWYTEVKTQPTAGQAVILDGKNKSELERIFGIKLD